MELGVELSRKGKQVTILEIEKVLNRTLNDINENCFKNRNGKMQNINRADRDSMCFDERRDS